MLTVSSIDGRNDGQAGPAAFTLIELLVVIAVIALLMAVLLPALAIAKERCRRAVCQSNIHQFALGIHVYANGNKDHLPCGFSDMMRFREPDEHTPIIAMATHDSLVASIGDKRSMRCPWLKEPFTSTNNWYYDRYANYGYLLGYNYLGGHGGTPWPMLGPANAEWISPQLSTEAGRLLIVTELNAWTTGENVTFAPHGKRGPILDYSNPGPGGGIPSEQVGAEGGNIGLLDGSVSWKKMRDMKIYRGSRMHGTGGCFTAW
ncbi:MAG: hypothetical protein DRP66_08835 [Planctomycetota bacterium]|nr:MAG: hypothetical protein DRP66_08835 [Planctomycetota bacterium]